MRQWKKCADSANIKHRKISLPTDPMNKSLTAMEIAHLLQQTSRVLSAKKNYPEMVDFCEVANTVLGCLEAVGGALESVADLTTSALNEKVRQSLFSHPSQIIEAYAGQQWWAIPGPDGHIALVLRVHSREDYNDLPFALQNILKPEWRPFLFVLQIEIFRPEGDSQDRACVTWAALALTSDGPVPFVLSKSFGKQYLPEGFTDEVETTVIPIRPNVLHAAVAATHKFINRLSGAAPTLKLTKLEAMAIRSVEPALRAVTENALRRSFVKATA